MAKGLEYAISLIDRSFGNGIRKAKQQTQGMDDAVGKMNTRIGKTKGIGNSSFGSLMSVAKKATVILGGVFALSSAIAFGKEVTNLTAQFEGYTNAIEFASGDEANKNFEFLDNTIKNLNLDVGASYKGFQTLTGSMKGTKLQGQGVRDIFEGVATAATVMNLSGEQAEGAFLALSQMASKGKVQAEELRGQLGERIPGALKIAADAMGVTQIQFNELLDSGKIYADDFLPKFSKQLKETFESGLPKAANSMQSAINKKNNALLSFKRNFGEAFRPVLIEVLSVGSRLFGFLGELLQHLDPIKTAFKGVYNALQPLIQSYADAMAPLEGLTKSGNKAEMIMIAIGRAIEGVTPLIRFIAEIFGFLNQQVNKVRNALWEHVQAMNESGAAGEFLANVMDTLKYIWEAIQPAVSAVFDIIVALVPLLFMQMKVIMDVVNALFAWGKKTEWVQRLLNALLGSVRSIFGNIRDIVVNSLGSVSDLMVGVFTMDVSKIKSGLKKALDAQLGVAKQMFAGADGAMKGWNEELEAPIDKNVKVVVEQKRKNAPAGMRDYLASLDGSKELDPLKKDTPTATTGNSIAGSGGGNTKHSTFNIQSFVKEMTIKVETLKESPQDIKRMMNQVFNEWVSDLELRADV